MGDHPILRCPECGRNARNTMTKYGLRSDCVHCGLHSWHSKPLVSKDVHRARNHCHAVVDPIWQNAETAYEIEEVPGNKAHRRAIKNIQKAMRNRVYAWLSAMTGLPEPECHMAGQRDIAKLRRIYAAAKQGTPQIVRDWAKSREVPDA